MRLDSILTKNRVCTKSEAKVAIRKGLVKVDGVTVKKASLDVDGGSEVSFNGKILTFPSEANKFKYVMMNKPTGILSDRRSDTTEYPTFEDLVLEPRLRAVINPVGRLDVNSIGLLLLTDNGQLNHDLTHPKKDVPKTYLVTVRDKLDEDAMYLIKSGMKLFDGTLIRPIEIEEVEEKVYKMVLTEGKIHIIKKIFKTFDNWIEELKRVSIATLVLDENLKPGDYRELNQKEVDDLIRFSSGSE